MTSKWWCPSLYTVYGIHKKWYFRHTQKNTLKKHSYIKNMLLLLYWKYMNTHWSVLRGQGFVGAFIMKYIPEAVAFICCALTSAIKTGAVSCRAVDGDFPLRLNSFKRFIYRAVYRHHVSHRHHHDNNDQDIRGERPEPGLHPDHPGTAQDRTAGKSRSGGQTPGLYPVLPGFVCACHSFLKI